jgi:indolepyruvate ferredoxin oxidoreductase beta subunit
VSDDLNVRGSEVLGMAMRGGSISSSIRIVDDVYGPLIPLGKCDVLVGMEPAEALRNLSYLSYSSTVILNTEAMIQLTDSLGAGRYPNLNQLIEKLSPADGNTI